METMTTMMMAMTINLTSGQKSKMTALQSKAIQEALNCFPLAISRTTLMGSPTLSLNLSDLEVVATQRVQDEVKKGKQCVKFVAQMLIYPVVAIKASVIGI